MGSDPFSSDRERELRNENIVLLADDDLFMRLMVKKGLGDEFQIIELADGADVVARYQEQKPDIVFLDIHLPKKNGLDVLKEIMEFDQNAYVVMLSADSTHEKVHNCRQLGAKGFITKPFTKDKLHEYLMRCPTIR